MSDPLVAGKLELLNTHMVNGAAFQVLPFNGKILASVNSFVSEINILDSVISLTHNQHVVFQCAVIYVERFIQDFHVGGLLLNLKLV